MKFIKPWMLLILALYVAPTVYAQQYTLPHNHSSLGTGGPLGDVDITSIDSDEINPLTVMGGSGGVAFCGDDANFSAACFMSFGADAAGSPSSATLLEIISYMNYSAVNGANISVCDGALGFCTGEVDRQTTIQPDGIDTLYSVAQDFSFNFDTDITNIEFAPDNGNPINICSTDDCVVSVGNTSSTFNVAGAIDVDGSMVVDANAITADGVINITSGGSSIASVNNNNGNNVSICNLTDCTINLGAGGSTVNVNGSPLTGDVFASSAAQDGYIAFTAGIMMTWGNFDISGADFTDSETFAVAYEAAPWSCTVSVQENGSTNSHNIMITGLSTTTITVQHLDDTGGETPNAAFYQCFGPTE